MTTSRRSFIATTLAAACSKLTAQEAVEPVIDIHQHMNYHLRSDEHLLLHQKAMGVTKSIILPGGTYVNQPSTHNGKSNGLAAKCVGTAWARDFAQLHPDAYLWACNEVTDLASAPAELEHWLKQGACMIAEQKFMVECDSAASQKLYELAAAYQVPILMHFQLTTYNFGYDRMHKMFEKHPKTNFIGHAQTVWGNIDKNYDWKNNYPKGKVTPGGLTDRYLADYPNFFADMSAGSGLNALTRDEDHTRGFFDRHQDKILYGSDCADHLGRGPGCQGAGTIAMIRKLAPNPKAVRKILFENAKRVLRLEV